MSAARAAVAAAASSGALVAVDVYAGAAGRSTVVCRVAGLATRVSGTRAVDDVVLVRADGAMFTAALGRVRAVRPAAEAGAA